MKTTRRKALALTGAALASTVTGSAKADCSELQTLIDNFAAVNAVNARAENHRVSAYEDYEKWEESTKPKRVKVIKDIFLLVPTIRRSKGSAFIKDEYFTARKFAEQYMEGSEFDRQIANLEQMQRDALTAFEKAWDEFESAPEAVAYSDAERAENATYQEKYEVGTAILAYQVRTLDQLHMKSAWITANKDFIIGGLDAPEFEALLSSFAQVKS